MSQILIVFIALLLLAVATWGSEVVEIDTVHQRRRPKLPVNADGSSNCGPTVPCGKMTGYPAHSTWGKCTKPGETCVGKGTGYNKVYSCVQCPRGCMCVWNCMASCAVPTWYETVFEGVRSLLGMEGDEAYAHEKLRYQ